MNINMLLLSARVDTLYCTKGQIGIVFYVNNHAHMYLIYLSFTPIHTICAFDLWILYTNSHHMGI